MLLKFPVSRVNQISLSLVLFSPLATRKSILVSDSSFSFFHKSDWTCRDFSHSRGKFSRLRSSCCFNLVIWPSKKRIFCLLSSNSGKSDWLLELVYSLLSWTTKSWFFCSRRSTASRISTTMVSYFWRCIVSLSDISATCFCSSNLMSAALRKSASNCLTLLFNSPSRIKKLVLKSVFHWRVSSRLLWSCISSLS